MDTTNIHIVEEPEKQLAMHPRKFSMWLFIVTVVMIFAALTSAYIVRQAEGNWREYELPLSLWINSGIIILSSATMHWAYLSAKKDNLEMVKVAISSTTFLGVLFLIGQMWAWNVLVSNEVYFTGGNPSESFLYVLTGLHGAHLVSAIIYLFIVLFATFRYQVHSKNLAKIEMCATYWHFLDILWLYLFIFLLLNH